MIAKPNLNELLNTVLNAITEQTGITNTQKGSISRILTESFLTEVVNLYDYVDQAFANLSLSTASSSYLDLKGALMQCIRKDGTETDTNYRYRISQQPFVIARENLDDLEASLLNIADVKKVYIDEYANGGGSFNVYIFTDAVDTPASVISEAQTVCYNHKAFGIMGEIKTPEKLYVNLDVLIRPKVSIGATTLKQLAMRYLKDRIDNVNSDTIVNFTEMIDDLNSTLGTDKIIIDDIKINNNSIYNYSSFNLNAHSRLVFDDVAVTIVE